MYLRARRGQPKRLLDRKVEPLAAKQVWAGVPLVIAVAAVALSLSSSLPTQTSSAPIGQQAQPGPVGFKPSPLDAPTGWTTVAEQRNYAEVQRLYGDGACTGPPVHDCADSGMRDWDKLSRPRTIVVDSIVTRRPFSFGIYPARVVYGLTSAARSGTPDRPRHGGPGPPDVGGRRQPAGDLELGAVRLGRR